jgi:hypothetical protein
VYSAHGQQGCSRGTLLNEMIVEKTHSDEPLLDSCVCQANTGIDSDDIRTAAVRSNGQIAHVPGDLSTTGSQWINLLSRAYVQIIGETARVCLDRARSKA